jgi:hypothetical protein
MEEKCQRQRRVAGVERRGPRRGKDSYLGEEGSNTVMSSAS